MTVSAEFLALSIPNRIRAWIADLRSGEFRQTKGHLRRGDNGYCCMGVLANRVNPNAWELMGSADKSGRWKFDDKSLYAIPAYLLKDVSMFGGIFDLYIHPYAKITWEAYLVELNDNGSTFGEIADVIEKKMLPMVLEKYPE